MHLLVLNCGSSSIKFAAFRTAPLAACLRGRVEAIGSREARLVLTPPNGPEQRESCTAPDHRRGLALIASRLRGRLPPPAAVGHRVVHGGERFRAPVVIDEAVVTAIEATLPLAPLHNPVNLAGIRLARTLWPDAVQIAAFDTAFHHTLPSHAFRYAVPKRWYEVYGIRRYGFHGLSHAYVAGRAAAHLGRSLDNLNLISLHLGNGASACAIARGQSVDTSMGFTPLEGLAMGTRPGDLDPGVLLHLLDRHRLPPGELAQTLNHASGLAGLCGLSDLRAIHAAIARGDEDARLALDIFCQRVKKYLGAYLAVLGRVDAIIFTGGIGENDPQVRALSLAGLEPFGIAIDPDKNHRPLQDVMEIQSARGIINVLAIATDEAREIARSMLPLITP